MRTDEPEMRTDEPGMRTDEPGMRKDEPGRRTDGPGMWTDAPGMWTNRPGRWNDSPQRMQGVRRRLRSLGKPVHVLAEKYGRFEKSYSNSLRDDVYCKFIVLSMGYRDSHSTLMSELFLPCRCASDDYFHANPFAGIMARYGVSCSCACSDCCE